MSKMISLVATLTLIAAFPGVVLAQPVATTSFENLDRIDSLVAMTVGANLGEPGGPSSPVDRRLRLAACPNTPTVEGPVFGAAIVKCDAVGWRIRVALVPGGMASAAPAGIAPRQPFSATGRAVAPAQQAPREIVVKKGDPLQLIAGGASFQVSRMVVADQDGAIGDLVRVRGEERNAPAIFARVQEMGIVRVPGFNNN